MKKSCARLGIPAWTTRTFLKQFRKRKWNEVLVETVWPRGRFIKTSASVEILTRKLLWIK